MPKSPKFYALIKQASKYHGQDGGKPFPVYLDHSPDGYIWEGNDNRYRVIDLILLMPCSDPNKPVEESSVLVFDLEDKPVSEEELEREYQQRLKKTEWFRVIPHQGVDIFFLNRFGHTVSNG
ncbi:MAG: hypothetical protein DBP02_10145 [gamma proteobacterium symbiont of Ctena orbiculata]|nr:MAG: hypothetical protein DBP02_10145 [gamma proteobacterium symbiont of Ctena orbiculata]